MTDLDDRGSPCCAMVLRADENGVVRRVPDWPLHYAIRSHEDAVAIEEEQGREAWLTAARTNKHLRINK